VGKKRGNDNPLNPHRLRSCWKGGETAGGGSFEGLGGWQMGRYLMKILEPKGTREERVLKVKKKKRYKLTQKEGYGGR